jgi:hypothetical protein
MFCYRKNTKAIAFEEFILSENIHRGEIEIENPRYALLFIVVLLKNLIHHYTNAIFNYTFWIVNYTLKHS